MKFVVFVLLFVAISADEVTKVAAQANVAKPVKVAKPAEDKMVKLNDPVTENRINIITKACRDLNDEYDSYVDAEKQLYTRIEEVSQKEKQAQPRQLIDLRKQVDDMYKSLLSIKKNKVKISAEMGKVLERVEENDRQKIVASLGIQKKLKFFAEVTEFLEKKKKIDAANKKFDREFGVKEKIIKSEKAGEVEEKLAKELKVSFYKKVAVAQEMEVRLKEQVEKWQTINDQMKDKNLCKFQIEELVKDTAKKITDMIKEVRKVEKELKEKRKLIVKNNLKGFEKVVSQLKSLANSTKEEDLKQMVTTTLEKVKAKKPIIKHEKTLKKSLKIVTNEESRLSALVNKLKKQVKEIKKTSQCKQDEKLWKLTSEKAISLFDKLEQLEKKVKNH